MTKKMGIIVVLLLWGWLTIPAQAADIDGSKPVFCAFSRAVECDQRVGCDQVLPEEVLLPTFIKIDFQKKIVSMPEADSTRTTPIMSFVRADGKLILQGHEVRAWSLIINEKTAQMTLAVASEEDGFILFGSCMAP
jgi:hypothetical protein